MGVACNEERGLMIIENEELFLVERQGELPADVQSIKFMGNGAAAPFTSSPS